MSVSHQSEVVKAITPDVDNQQVIAVLGEAVRLIHEERAKVLRGDEYRDLELLVGDVVDCLPHLLKRFADLEERYLHLHQRVPPTVPYSRLTDEQVMERLDNTLRATRNLGMKAGAARLKAAAQPRGSRIVTEADEIYEQALEEVANHLPVLLDRMQKLLDHNAELAEALLSEHDSGVGRIAGERKRQIDQEDFPSTHDDKHEAEELAWAAVCYAAPESIRRVVQMDSTHIEDHGSIQTVIVQSISTQFFDPWPWDGEYDKRDKFPRIRRLEIAGALIAAEIDRLTRAAANAVRGGG